MALVKQTEVKAAIKAAGKKAGKDFLQVFEEQVAEKLKKAIADHNGGRKTLDAAVAKAVFGVKP